MVFLVVWNTVVNWTVMLIFKLLPILSKEWVIYIIHPLPSAEFTPSLIYPYPNFSPVLKLSKMVSWQKIWPDVSMGASPDSRSDVTSTPRTISCKLSMNKFKRIWHKHDTCKNALLVLSATFQISSVYTILYNLGDTVFILPSHWSKSQFA